MARTYHHDSKRFHPWENPKATQKGLLKYREDRAKGWGPRYGWTVDDYDWLGYYHRNYSSAGPGWFRRLMTTKPARRQEKLVESRFRNQTWMQIWKGFGDCSSNCPDCAMDRFEHYRQLDDIDTFWPVWNKPMVYYY